MAIVTLNPPLNRYSIGGFLFEKGVPMKLDPGIAKTFMGNKRLNVVFDNDEIAVASAAPVRQKVLSNAEKIAAIQEAMDDLSPDDDTNWTVDGKPEVRALSKVLGWNVTNDLRDAAVGARPVPKGGVKVIRRPKQPEGPIDTAADILPTENKAVEEESVEV